MQTGWWIMWVVAVLSRAQFFGPGSLLIASVEGQKGPDAGVGYPSAGSEFLHPSGFGPEISPEYRHRLETYPAFIRSSLA